VAIEVAAGAAVTVQAERKLPKAEMPVGCPCRRRLARVARAAEARRCPEWRARRVPEAVAVARKAMALDKAAPNLHRVWLAANQVECSLEAKKATAVDAAATRAGVAVVRWLLPVLKAAVWANKAVAAWKAPNNRPAATKVDAAATRAVAVDAAVAAMAVEWPAASA
jgi:hypothetical protein